MGRVGYCAFNWHVPDGRLGWVSFHVCFGHVDIFFLCAYSSLLPILYQVICSFSLTGSSSLYNLNMTPLSFVCNSMTQVSLFKREFWSCHSHGFYFLVSAPAKALCVLAYSLLQAWATSLLEPPIPWLFSFSHTSLLNTLPAPFQNPTKGRVTARVRAQALELGCLGFAPHM